MTPESEVGWTRLDWDSNHFGISIARITTSELSGPDLRNRIDTARSAGIQCLYWLTSREVASALKGSPSIKVLDSRLVYRRPVSTRNRQVAARLAPEVRVAHDDDLPALRELASDIHIQTRFHEDGSFSQLRARALYSRWIEKSFFAPDEIVFVCGRRGQPEGYVTCSPRDERATDIGLLAVAPKHQGKGLGHSLVGAAVSWATDRHHNSIEVVTQGRNSGARTLYERNQFALVSENTWIHIWLTDEESAAIPAGL